MRYGGAAVWEAMQGLVQRVGPALERIEGALPGDFPGRTWEAIAKGMRAQAAVFSSGLAGVRQTA
jgi:serine/threonine-protein kinase HipA